VIQLPEPERGGAAPFLGDEQEGFVAGEVVGDIIQEYFCLSQSGHFGDRFKRS